ncbi:uncharacterized protein LOC134821242 [Bolinopsis microptera]|uniref:uncharacterized protein LOC134821242 n=1 Tax=Bolinopsis microptera TaxID=2820187 RepID=UPI003079EDE9
MLLHFLALLCTVRAGLYRFSTATTPWEFRLETAQPDTTWFPVEFFQEYELGAPDETGAMPILIDNSNVVQKQLGIKKMSPICDDYWYDLEASEFCKMNGYRRGRRASFTTKDEFARTMLNCFDFVALTNDELGATSTCTVTDYKDATMPCNMDQAAAVYCWEHNYIPIKVVFLSVTNTVKKFKIKVMVGSEKYGRFYNSLLKDEALGTEPTNADFKFLTSGAQKELKLKVKIQKKAGAVTLSGKFPDSKKCYELYFKGKRFVQCMQSGKLKIKDFNVISEENVDVVKEKFVVDKESPKRSR